MKIDAVKLLANTTTSTAVKLLAVKQLARRGDTNAVTHCRMTWAAGLPTKNSTTAASPQ